MSKEIQVDVVYAGPDGIDPADHCCEVMVYALQNDYYVYYIPMWRIWGIGDRTVADRERKIAITHCPWCIKKLPMLLSGAWAEETMERGYRYDDPDLPDDLRTDRWWKEAGL